MKPHLPDELFVGQLQQEHAGGRQHARGQLLLDLAGHQAGRVVRVGGVLADDVGLRGVVQPH